MDRTRGPERVPLGFSYVKALRSEDGRLLGVLDSDFDLPALNRFLRALEQEYHPHSGG